TLESRSSPALYPDADSASRRAGVRSHVMSIQDSPSDVAAIATAAPEPVAAPHLPPGPRLPRALQTMAFMLAGPRFLEACRRRHGSPVAPGPVFDNRFVMLFAPALCKQLSQGSTEQLHAGEANALLGPILGQRSVLLLDGAEHLRHRRLMLPPFHGR